MRLKEFGNKQILEKRPIKESLPLEVEVEVVAKKGAIPQFIGN